MPYKDPEARRAHSREASRRAYQARAEKPLGVCASISCEQPAESGYCPRCRASRTAAKAAFRLRQKLAGPQEGVCSSQDCNEAARPGLKTCDRCAERSRRWNISEAGRVIKLEHVRSYRERAFAHYGLLCLCCGESREACLTLDHIDGYKEGPRSGVVLYRHLVQQGFPETVRTLCMSCNFCLGHYGHCFHGSGLVQETRLRPRVKPVSPERDAYVKSYREKMKRQTFLAYGGVHCAKCGEAQFEFLTIDHIGGTGFAHRKEAAQAGTIHTLLRQQGYPPGYRVYCFNCNLEDAVLRKRARAEDSALTPPLDSATILA